MSTVLQQPSYKLKIKLVDMIIKFKYNKTDSYHAPLNGDYLS